MALDFEIQGVFKRYLTAAWIVLMLFLYGRVELLAFERPGGCPEYWILLWVVFTGLLLIVPVYTEDLRDFLFVASLGPLLVIVQDWAFWLFKYQQPTLPQWYAGHYNFTPLPDAMLGFPWFYWLFGSVWLALGIVWLLTLKKGYKLPFPLTNGDPRT